MLSEKFRFKSQQYPCFLLSIRISQNTVISIFFNEKALYNRISGSLEKLLKEVPYQHFCSFQRLKSFLANAIRHIYDFLYGRILALAQNLAAMADGPFSTALRVLQKSQLCEHQNHDVFLGKTTVNPVGSLAN